MRKFSQLYRNESPKWAFPEIGPCAPLTPSLGRTEDLIAKVKKIKIISAIKENHEVVFRHP